MGKEWQMFGKKGKGNVVEFGNFISTFCSTLSIAAATILAEPNTSDNRFSGVLLRQNNAE